MDAIEECLAGAGFGDSLAAEPPGCVAESGFQSRTLLGKRQELARAPVGFEAGGQLSEDVGAAFPGPGSGALIGQEQLQGGEAGLDPVAVVQVLSTHGVETGDGVV